MAKKRSKKIVQKVNKKEKVKKTAKKEVILKQKKSLLTTYGFILSVVSLIIMLAYIVAIFITFNGIDLSFFTYLAAFVIFVVSLFGAVLSIAGSAPSPGNKSAKMMLYLNLAILAITFVLLLFKLYG